MQQLNQVALPMHSEVVFEPGGIHVMLMNLRNPL